MGGNQNFLNYKMNEKKLKMSILFKTGWPLLVFNKNHCSLFHKPNNIKFETKTLLIIFLPFVQFSKFLKFLKFSQFLLITPHVHPQKSIERSGKKSQISPAWCSFFLCVDLHILLEAKCLDVCRSRSDEFRCINRGCRLGHRLSNNTEFRQNSSTDQHCCMPT